MTKVSAPQPEMIGIREFARRDGCDEARVRKGIRDQVLHSTADKKLDAALVGSGWRLRNRRAADRAADKVRTVRNLAEVSAPEVSAVSALDTAPAEAAERILLASGAPWSQGEAERVKENYLALLRQLEYDQKARTVVTVADVARLVGEEYAKVRTRLLALPSGHAPQLARITSPAVMQQTLYGLIERALADLAQADA